MIRLKSFFNTYPSDFCDHSNAAWKLTKTLNLMVVLATIDHPIHLNLFDTPSDVRFREIIFHEIRCI